MVEADKNGQAQGMFRMSSGTAGCARPVACAGSGQRWEEG